MLFERNVYQPYVHKGGDRVGSPNEPSESYPRPPLRFGKISPPYEFYSLSTYAGFQNKLYPNQ